MVKRPSNFVRRGWCQGVNYKPGTGGADCYCAFAAIETLPILDLKAEYAKRLTGREYCINEIAAITKWNDAPSRTQAEVVALLERVEAEMTDVDWEPIGGAE